MYDPIMFEPEVIKAGHPRQPKPQSVFSHPLYVALDMVKETDQSFNQDRFQALLEDTR